MALLGGCGVIHRNCPFVKQLEMVKKVKRARSFIIDDVATISPDAPVAEAIERMKGYAISGLVVTEDNRVVGIFTKRDIPYQKQSELTVRDVMTPDPICAMQGISREEALQKLWEIRKEKLPIVDDDGNLQGLITLKDMQPEFPNASLDDRGRLLVGLGCSPFLPKSKSDQNILMEIAQHVDIFFTDVAQFYKTLDMSGTKQLMEALDSRFILGNIGTFEAAEYILTKAEFPDDKLIGIKVGMGSGSICTTTIQTGVGAPTLYATAEVADAIRIYNPKIALIADGGFKNPGDLPKAFAVGADAIMSGHFFAGCTESPGYVDTIGGRKVKVYRGMGSKEARSVGQFSLDRYNVGEGGKKLAEGVSDYVPFTGPVQGVLEQLVDGLKNGMVYAGAQTLREMWPKPVGWITFAGKIEAGPHDLLSR
jgi:IMP dehydrogenase